MEALEVPRHDGVCCEKVKFHLPAGSGGRYRRRAEVTRKGQKGNPHTFSMQESFPSQIDTGCKMQGRQCVSSEHGQLAAENIRVCGVGLEP